MAVRRDLVTALFGVFFLAGAALLWWEGSRQDFNVLGSGIAYDPLFFPRLLLGLGGIFATGILILGLTTKNVDRNEPRWNLWFALVLLIAAYFWATVETGFLVATAPFVILFCVLLGYRRWAVTVPAAIGITVLVWYTFTAWLKVPLPSSGVFERLVG
jgi:hypothetical protein